ncbi:hypothetical protein CISIN_1g032470mg [Citrus sinensis]|uniref:HIT-type domain-containing protein n=1 Tax=Citrus sinensis TaxID=2711 RepID=A0A067FQV4_CITSI|nr:hypothetical protein CISIN_1g032470mg [Citrus sinensis]
MGPPARLCQVCNEAQSKYKCPNCFTPYCSLVCFKNHKETPCAKPEPTEEKPIFPESPVERSLNADEPSQVLQKEQLESIGMVHKGVKLALNLETINCVVQNVTLYNILMQLLPVKSVMHCRMKAFRNLSWVLIVPPTQRL